MSSARIALIACTNGLGHVRRMLALALALQDRGARATLMAPRASVDRLVQVYGVPAPDIVDFDSRTTHDDWLSTDSRRWMDGLPTLDTYDEIVSDNLIEILAVRQNAWLSGSFFWHRALLDFPHAKATYAEDLLRLHRPRMISTGLFSATYLQDATRLANVGLYALGAGAQLQGGEDLLVACGRGGEVVMATRDLLNHIAAGPRPGAAMVWVEPSLYWADMPDWMQPATFTPCMYARLRAAVIRPGVGTATDALLAGVRLFMFHEPDNMEMVDNAGRLSAAGVGLTCAGPREAWRAAVAYMSSAQAQALHMVAARAIDRDGAAEAARLILVG